MKRCPQCNRVETDETLKFCRNDGAVLVEDSAVVNESSATRILPTSPRGEAQVVHTDSENAQIITTGLEPAKQPKPETTSTSGGVAGSSSFVTRLKHRKAVTILIGAFMIIATVVFSYSFFPHTSKSAETIDSIAVLPFANTSGDPNTDF